MAEFLLRVTQLNSPTGKLPQWLDEFTQENCVRAPAKRQSRRARA